MADVGAHAPPNPRKRRLQAVDPWKLAPASRARPPACAGHCEAHHDVSGYSRGTGNHKSSNGGRPMKTRLVVSITLLLICTAAFAPAQTRETPQHTTARVFQLL